MNLVSIIVPFHNTDIYLFEKCLESLLNQTYENIEIIIIDDGSGAEYKEYLNKKSIIQKVRIINLQQSGVSVARNKGVQEARGEYLTFVDSDDVLIDTMVSEAVEIIKENKLDIVIGRMKKVSCIEKFTVSENNSTTEWPNKLKIIDTSYESGFENNVFCSDDKYKLKDDKWEISFQAPVARLVKTKIARKVEFPQGIKISEDTIWNYRILKNKDLKVGLLRSNWYQYIQNSASTLGTLNEDSIKAIIETIKTTNSMLDDKKNNEKYIKWVFTKIRQIIKVLKNGSFTGVNRYMNIVAQEPFNEILKIRSKYSLKINLKILLFKTTLGYYYY